MATGTIGSTFQNGWTGTSFIFDVGGGWYRCVIIANTTTGTNLQAIYYPSVTGDNDTNVFVDDIGHFWGAQLEQRSSVTAYTPTTTAPISNYIPVLQTAPAGVARFDHNPITGESLGLLVEEGRTNLLFPSNGTGAFGNSIGLTFSPIVVPDGSIVSCLWNSTGVTTNRYEWVINPNTYPSGQQITWSWFQKRVRGTGPTHALVPDNVINATIVTGSTKVADVGNGWERWSVVFSITTGSESTTLRLYISSSLDLVFNAFAIWGLQVEVGAFPTSYIKTEATAVTRQGDNVTMTGNNFSSWYRQDEGALFFDCISGSSTLPQAVFAIDNGSYRERIVLFNDNASQVNTTPSFAITNNGVTQVSTGHTTSTLNSPHKMAGAYKLNDSAAVFDAGSVSSDLNCTMPIGVNRANFGNSSWSGQTFNGQIRKITYYPTRVSNINLQALTT